MSESDTNTRLVIILDQSIKGLLHLNEETAISYRQVSYFKNLLKEISSYPSTPAVPLPYASITELLISWKFNDFAFIAKCVTISEPKPRRRNPTKPGSNL